MSSEEALAGAISAVACIKVRVQMRDAQGYPFSEPKDVEFYRNEVLAVLQALHRAEVFA